MLLSTLRRSLKPLCSLALGAGLFFGLLHAPDAAAQIKVEPGQKVAFLGDSITQFGWDRPGGYVHIVADALESLGIKISVVPAGISGHKSNQMLARLEHDVIEKKPDWMTLSCGVNDVWHGTNGVSLEDYKKNITEIVEKAQAAGIKVVILTATVISENDNPNNQKLAAYNDFLRELAKEKGLPLADLNALFWEKINAQKESGTRKPLTSDGVHMAPAGNMLMARGVLETFGVTPAQVDAYEAAWRKQPDGAAVMASVNFPIMAPVSVEQYETVIPALAREQKTDTNRFLNNQMVASLRKVCKAREADETVTLDQLHKDLSKAFAEDIQELCKQYQQANPAQ
jgi:lysophospholipase L1-like esterase